jgi:hypothetical protein
VVYRAGEKKNDDGPAARILIPSSKGCADPAGQVSLVRFGFLVPGAILHPPGVVPGEGRDQSAQVVWRVDRGIPCAFDPILGTLPCEHNFVRIVEKFFRIPRSCGGYVISTPRSSRDG